MKKTLLLWLLCVPIFILSNPFASAQPQSGPRMFLGEKHHDFKEVNEGAIVEHTFRVENRGDQVLEIQRVNPG